MCQPIEPPATCSTTGCIQGEALVTVMSFAHETQLTVCQHPSTPLGAAHRPRVGYVHTSTYCTVVQVIFYMIARERDHFPRTYVAQIIGQLTLHFVDVIKVCVLPCLKGKTVLKSLKTKRPRTIFSHSRAVTNSASCAPRVRRRCVSARPSMPRVSEAVVDPQPPPPLAAAFSPAPPSASASASASASSFEASGSERGSPSPSVSAHPEDCRCRSRDWRRARTPRQCS